jgi:hypothetical protein
MRTDRQVGMANLIVAFRNFTNAPKNTLQSAGNMCVWTRLIIMNVLYESMA